MIKKIRPLDIDDFLMDLDAIMSDHKIEKADIRIQIGVNDEMVKITGNLAFGDWSNNLCKCGCRLRVYDGLAWCSSPKCSFIGRYYCRKP